MNGAQMNAGYTTSSGDPSGNPYPYNQHNTSFGGPSGNPYPYNPYYPPPQAMQSTNNTAVVTHQPAVVTQPVIQQVPDRMGLAIFVTLCCFWPLGIVAIMKASESRSALNHNDFVAANKHAESSKRLSLISIGCGVVSLIIVIVCVAVFFSNRKTLRYYTY
ncbi:proline-rich transmembrane protein 1 isoform X3 [Aplysia californica]|uniref:Proline-rich transmembrane protein 1 isoform X3 n=1 Tax=Aplysia californica TaxID=6500 RepID=A0ABM0KAK2_APLCA|nr:proline-rich transmembrane protein 1 isoform X3 [Aplysia californica]